MPIPPISQNRPIYAHSQIESNRLRYASAKVDLEYQRQIGDLKRATEKHGADQDSVLGRLDSIHLMTMYTRAGEQENITEIPNPDRCLLLILIEHLSQGNHISHNAVMSNMAERFGFRQGAVEDQVTVSMRIEELIHERVLERTGESAEYLIIAPGYLRELLKGARAVHNDEVTLQGDYGGPNYTTRGNMIFMYPAKREQPKPEDDEPPPPPPAA